MDQLRSQQVSVQSTQQIIKRKFNNSIKDQMMTAELINDLTMLKNAVTSKQALTWAKK